MDMVNVATKHIGEEAAEKYSLGQFSARKVAEIEEHLLVCESCRTAVTAADAYVATMRTAAAKVRKAEQNSKKKNRSAVGR